MVSGYVLRNEGKSNVTYVTLPGVEAILPYSEKIPRENYRPDTRIQALVIEVKKVGAKVKVVLSRSRPLLSNVF